MSNVHFFGKAAALGTYVIRWHCVHRDWLSVSISISARVSATFHLLLEKQFFCISFLSHEDMQSLCVFIELDYNQSKSTQVSESN